MACVRIWDVRAGKGNGSYALRWDDKKSNQIIPILKSSAIPILKSQKSGSKIQSNHPNPQIPSNPNLKIPKIRVKNPIKSSQSSNPQQSQS
jgi:hypothetical protein